VTLGGETGNRSVERISKLFHSYEIPLSAILVMPFKFEKENFSIDMEHVSLDVRIICREEDKQVRNHPK